MPEHAATSSRKLAAERTREALLDSGLVLAETTGLEGLSVNALVEQAGVSKGTFFHHFKDRTSYLVALHRRFHDLIFDEVTVRIVDLEPGHQRLTVMSQTYLDVCLRDRGVKALILEARGSRAVADEVLRRNAANVNLVAEDFTALGWPNPRAIARLWVAANAEAALVELELGHKDLATREAIAQLTG